MEKTIIRKSKTFNSVGMIVSFILIILSIVGFPADFAIFACFMLVVAIGLFLVSIYSFRDSTPQMILDEKGIYVHELGREHIPWADLESAKLKKIPRGGTYIVLELRDDSLYPSLGYKGLESKLMTVYGLSRLTVAVTGLAISPTQLLQKIQQRILNEMQPNS